MWVSRTLVHLISLFSVNFVHGCLSFYWNFMHALNKTEQARLRIYEMLFIGFKWFKQTLASAHCVNNHSRLKERVLIVLGYCIYSKKIDLFWMCVFLTHPFCRYTEFCTASWYHMHVTSRHHWGIPGVPVPTQHNLSMAMRGCRAKQKHNKSALTMLDLCRQHLIAGT